MPAVDAFSTTSETLISPADNMAPVTPNDSADLDFITRALMVANAGTLKVTQMNGVAVTITVPAGILPIRVARVWSTGTTATGITAIW